MVEEGGKAKGAKAVLRHRVRETTIAIKQALGRLAIPESRRLEDVQSRQQSSQALDDIVLAVVASDQDRRSAVTPTSNQAGFGGEHGLHLPEVATPDSGDERLLIVRRDDIRHAFTPSWEDPGAFPWPAFSGIRDWSRSLRVEIGKSRARKYLSPPSGERAAFRAETRPVLRAERPLAVARRELG